MDYDLALQNIKDWIKDLIIVQYKQSPKNKALIDLLCEIILANNLILKIRDLCLSVDKSEGVQLDVVGKWVGMDRFYNGVELWDGPMLSYPYFTTIETDSYDSFQGGFSKYTTFADNDGGFLMYKRYKRIRTQANAIKDEFFKELIKLKIIQNSINHTCKNIDDAIWEWSSGNVFTTWQKMKVIYNYNSSYKNIMFLANYKNVLPRPTGCSLELKEI